jgi:hypothetical protein
VQESEGLLLAHQVAGTDGRGDGPLHEPDHRRRSQTAEPDQAVPWRQPHGTEDGEGDVDGVAVDGPKHGPVTEPEGLGHRFADRRRRHDRFG